MEFEKLKKIIAEVCDVDEEQNYNGFYIQG